MKAVIDILLIIIIALCTWNGYKRGLVGGVAAILAIIISLLGASIISTAYSHEVVPALEPFVSGYLDSHRNRDAILERMGYGSSELSLEDILKQDSSLRYDYAYEETGVTMTKAIVTVLCDTITSVGTMVIAFLLILILLVAVASVGNLSFRLPNLENLDEIGGAMLGFGEGFLFCILLCWLLSFLGIIIGKDTMAHTTLGRFFLIFDSLTSSLL